MEENGQQPGCDRLLCPPYAGPCGLLNIGLSGIATSKMVSIPRRAADAACTAAQNAAIYFHRIKCKLTTSNLLSHWGDSIIGCGWNTIGMNYYIVKRYPSMHWANLLQKHVADSRIRGWAASIIWWAYPNNQSPDRNSLLYGMMELFRPSVFGRDEELNSVFEKLGLPKPVHETFQPTHPSNRQPKILGHL
mgnify:CR=1 FL=1